VAPVWVTEAFVGAEVFLVADAIGVDGCAHVPRTGLRPVLLLYRDFPHSQQLFSGFGFLP
jgi:hypothetical protein